MASEVLSLFREPVGLDSACGREAELSVLLREHEEARASERARFVFVRGPAGVGKSHLFGLLHKAVFGRGAPVFEAESPRECKRPFGLFARVVGELLEHLSHAGVPDQKLAELSNAVAPLSGCASRTEVMQDRRLVLYDAICELFTLAGRESPVFLFPDLDVADKSSLELFRYLAAVATAPESRSAGLFVASFRDDGRLPQPLDEVVGKVCARSLPLAGLDVDGIRAYLSRREVAQRLLEVTGGNPDALEELLSRPAGKPIELFTRRVERMSAEQQAVLELLAACRDALPQEVVLGALGRLGKRVDASVLDELVQKHVVAVKVVSGRPVYRFARDTEKHAFASGRALFEVKKALGHELRDCGELHAAAALLLEVDPASGAETATAAADSLSARGAHEDAAELYLSALPHLVPSRKAVVLRRLSEVAAAQGQFRAAIRYLLASRRFGAAPDAELANRAARLLIRLSRLKMAARVLALAGDGAAPVNRAELELLSGRPDEAIRLGVEALKKPLAPEQAVAVRNVVGKALLVKGELEAAERAFEENAAVARAHGLVQLVALAELNTGVAAHKRGDLKKAIRCYQASTHGHCPAQAQALANLGSLYADSGDFELALDYLSRALQAFSRFSGQREIAHVASNLARLNHFLGDLDRAIELSEHALSLSKEIGERYLEGSALLNLGAILIDKRELHEAQKLLDEARARFEEVGNEGYAALSCALKARAHLLSSERALATAELSRRVVDRGVRALPAAAVEVELTWAELCLKLDDLHGASRAANRAREALLSRPELEGPYRVYYVMGRLKLAAGDTSGAQAEMARAARLLDELTQRVPAVRRTQFLSVPRRAEVLAAFEPELRLPKGFAVAGLPERAEHGLVGQSPALLKVVRQLSPIGRSNATVLIRGESGTGKELLAEAIHNLSGRKGMPLVKVNCAAMVEELLLSELFGHEKGAFTGAIRERKGRFELADGGTLFLDEIGDISPKCQVALLRVLQEREFERVGGTKTIKVDVRVICATNRDLESLIAQGRFRQDLYYRLKGVMLELPPLRERLEDLPLLCAHFLARIAKERHEPPKQLSREAIELLSRHSWPGNVRELENVLASAAIFADGPVIGPEAFAHVAELAALTSSPASPPPVRVVAPVEGVAVCEPPMPAAPPAEPADGPIDYYSLARRRGISLKDLRHEVEMQCIKRALLEAKGNISEAARLLRMKRSRLSQIVNAEPELKGVVHGGD